MSRLIEVSLKTTPLDDLLGTGTLILEFPGKHGEVKLADIPHARQWNNKLNEVMMPEKSDKDQDHAPGQAKGRTAA